MRLKTVLPLIIVTVLGVIFASLFSGNVLLNQAIQPFGSLQDRPAEGQPASENQNEGLVRINTGQVEQLPEGFVGPPDQARVSFTDRDFLTGWIPWLIQQVSILIGGLSLVVFVYAGVNLIIRGDNEEQLGKSTKMILFGVIGIALAGFSYTIIANVLALF